MSCFQSLLQSFPTWERGQKSSFQCRYFVKPRVVPYVGTWIEIWMTCFRCLWKSSRSLRGNVDRNAPFSYVRVELQSRSLRGIVDRNTLFSPISTNLLLSFPTWERGQKYLLGKQIPYVPRRSLRGNVDRNHTGEKGIYQIKQSFPTWERGQKYNAWTWASGDADDVVPYVGTWIEI